MFFTIIFFPQNNDPNSHQHILMRNKLQKEVNMIPLRNIVCTIFHDYTHIETALLKYSLSKV